MDTMGAKMKRGINGYALHAHWMALAKLDAILRGGGDITDALGKYDGGTIWPGQIWILRPMRSFKVQRLAAVSLYDISGGTIKPKSEFLDTLAAWAVRAMASDALSPEPPDLYVDPYHVLTWNDDPSAVKKWQLIIEEELPLPDDIAEIFRGGGDYGDN